MPYEVVAFSVRLARLRFRDSSSLFRSLWVGQLCHYPALRRQAISVGPIARCADQRGVLFRKQFRCRCCDSAGRTRTLPKRAPFSKAVHPRSFPFYLLRRGYDCLRFVRERTLVSAAVYCGNNVKVRRTRLHRRVRVSSAAYQSRANERIWSAALGTAIDLVSRNRRRARDPG